MRCVHAPVEQFLESEVERLRTDTIRERESAHITRFCVDVADIVIKGG